MIENRAPCAKQLCKIFNLLQSNVLHFCLKTNFIQSWSHFSHPPPLLLSSSRTTSRVTTTPPTTLPTTPDSSTSPVARSALWWRLWPPWDPFQSPSMPVTSPSSFTSQVSSRFWEETQLKLFVSATCFVFFVTEWDFFGGGVFRNLLWEGVQQWWAGSRCAGGGLWLSGRRCWRQEILDCEEQVGEKR